MLILVNFEQLKMATMFGSGELCPPDQAKSKGELVWKAGSDGYLLMNDTIPVIIY